MGAGSGDGRWFALKHPVNLGDLSGGDFRSGSPRSFMKLPKWLH
jgi:hypothetical protein